MLACLGGRTTKHLLSYMRREVLIARGPMAQGGGLYDPSCNFNRLLASLITFFFLSLPGHNFHFALKSTRVLPASPNFGQAKHGQNGPAATFCQQGIC